MYIRVLLVKEGYVYEIWSVFDILIFIDIRGIKILILK